MPTAIDQQHRGFQCTRWILKILGFNSIRVLKGIELQCKIYSKLLVLMLQLRSSIQDNPLTTGCFALFSEFLNIQNPILAIGSNEGIDKRGTVYRQVLNIGSLTHFQRLHDLQ